MGLGQQVVNLALVLRNLMVVVGTDDISSYLANLKSLGHLTLIEDLAQPILLQRGHAPVKAGHRARVAVPNLDQSVTDPAARCTACRAALGYPQARADASRPRIAPEIG